MKYLILACLILTSCNDPVNSTKPIVTIEEARKRMDAAGSEMSLANAICYELGCRDVMVSVQIDTSIAPLYFRLPRK